MNAKWFPVLGKLGKHQPLGECPFCHKESLDYGFKVVNKDDKMGFGIVWCKDCHHAAQLSRIKVEDDTKKLEDVPEKLIV
ncbi:MAG: hypothetical protein SPL39_02845 [Selenomonadaceae bacterium]|nr:hypothetical protein [Selenomonadaceae bacterium]